MTGSLPLPEEKTSPHVATFHRLALGTFCWESSFPGTLPVSHDWPCRMELVGLSITSGRFMVWSHWSGRRMCLLNHAATLETNKQKASDCLILILDEAPTKPALRMPTQTEGPLRYHQVTSEKKN